MKFNSFIVVVLVIYLSSYLIEANRTNLLKKISSSLLSSRSTSKTKAKTKTKTKTSSSSSSSRRTEKTNKLLNQYSRDFKSLQAFMNTKFLEVNINKIMVSGIMYKRDLNKLCEFAYIK